jgi:alpha-glucosidase
LHDLRELRQAEEPDRIVELGEIVNEFADEVRLKARDHGRMPMPWDASRPQAGFSDGNTSTPPWTRLNSDFDLCNVDHQEKLSNSVLEFWRKMLVFRRQYSEALVFGDFTPLSLDNNPVFAYHKTPAEHAAGDVSLLVMLNLTNEKDLKMTMPASVDGRAVTYSALECSRSTKGVNNLGKKYKTGEEVELRSYEGVIFSYE